MNFRHALQLAALASTLVAGISLASDAREGAMLGFTIASESPKSEAGSVDRHSVQSRVLVAFDEKFAMQQQGMRVEIVAHRPEPLGRHRALLLRRAQHADGARRHGAVQCRRGGSQPPDREGRRRHRLRRLCLSTTWAALPTRR